MHGLADPAVTRNRDEGNEDQQEQNPARHTG